MNDVRRRTLRRDGRAVYRRRGAFSHMRELTRRAIVPVGLSLAVWCAGLHVVSASRAAIPARIVSTSPSITETLFALGLGDRVVGVSTYCRFPAAAAKLVFSSIRQVASAAGVTPRGDALVADLQGRLDAIRRAGASAPAPRVLFIIGRRPGTLADLVAVGAGSYINDLIEIAGGKNVLAITGQPEYPRISMETVLRLDPDVIVDTVGMGETEAERVQRQPVNEQLWSAYGSLSAVKTHRLHAATTDALVVPGPRVVEAAEWVQGLLRRKPAR